ncbi:MAG: META domain-containing protein [Dysgonamonadaceae bacterium]|jgi:hypothetical protein|nr:META domain-containing protein [Dysgonamonadaceae bacterium]
MKTIKFSLFILICTASYTGCSENQSNSENSSLTETKWKLTSFVTSGDAKTPEPESDNNYWIIFKDDSTFLAKSSTNDLAGKYKLNFSSSTISITELGGTKINELFDGKFFVESLAAVRSFDLQEDALKLYYNEADYLLFTAYRDTESPVALPVADFNVPAGCSMNYSKMQQDSVFVINSEEEWAKIFTCESNPQIDFATKTLLVAWGGTTNGIANISKELLLENNTYSLTVDIIQDMTTVAQGWHMVLITDKINTQRVALNLNKHFGDGSPACLWEQITPVTPSNEQRNRLDNVFSGNNKLLGSIKGDTLIVINNQADMVKFQGFSEYPDLWMAFDWENQTIIGGKISTPSVSDEILSRQLSECLNTSLFLYNIEVKKCTSCWTAIGSHYFWAIYARKLNTENVSLIIKTVE